MILNHFHKCIGSNTCCNAEYILWRYYNYKSRVFEFTFSIFDQHKQKLTYSCFINTKKCIIYVRFDASRLLCKYAHAENLVQMHWVQINYIIRFQSCKMQWVNEIIHLIKVTNPSGNPCKYHTKIYKTSLSLFPIWPSVPCLFLGALWYFS